MAVELVIRLDATAATDAIAELRVLYAALLSRHGERFRDLQVRIERAVEGGVAPQIHHLGDGEFTASVPVLADLLREGRALGVL